MKPSNNNSIPAETLRRYERELERLEAVETDELPDKRFRAFALLTEMALVSGSTAIVIECCNCAFERLSDQQTNR